MRDLVRPGGAVIPARGRVLVALADYTPKKGSLGTVDGFDLSPFNEFLPAVHTVAVGDKRIVSRSAPQTLFAFDFGSAADCLPGRAVAELVATGGRVTGCAQWIALEMDEEGRYEVGPPAPGKTSCWGVRFHSLPQPLDTRPGQVVRVCGSHNRRALTVWFEGAR